jgi:hypothetical protein
MWILHEAIFFILLLYVSRFESHILEVGMRKIWRKFVQNILIN